MKSRAAAAATPSLRELLEVARKVCTEKQLDALAIYDAGYGVRTIARQLGISPQAVRDRLDEAMRKIQRVVGETAS